MMGHTLLLCLLAAAAAASPAFILGEGMLPNSKGMGGIGMSMNFGRGGFSQDPNAMACVAVTLKCQEEFINKVVANGRVIYNVTRGQGSSTFSPSEEFASCANKLQLENLSEQLVKFSLADMAMLVADVKMSPNERDLVVRKVEEACSSSEIAEFNSCATKACIRELTDARASP